MPVFRDRVKDTTTSTGTGNITLSGTAPTGYRDFNTAFTVGPVFLYCIAGGAEWETGAGYLSASTTLVRSEVFDSSAGPRTACNFSAGTKDVFCSINSHWCEDTDTGATQARINGLAMP